MLKFIAVPFAMAAVTLGAANITTSPASPNMTAQTRAAATFQVASASTRPDQNDAVHGYPT